MLLNLGHAPVDEAPAQLGREPKPPRDAGPVGELALPAHSLDHLRGAIRRPRRSNSRTQLAMLRLTVRSVEDGKLALAGVRPEAVVVNHERAVTGRDRWQNVESAQAGLQSRHCGRQ